MARAFNPGDLVRLKSGGPAMTVIQYGHWNHEAQEQVNCRWFVDPKQLPLEQIFFEHELQLVPATAVEMRGTNWG